MTLVDHTDQGVQLPAETRALLTSLISVGIEVGIVTGRYVWEMREILERLNMHWARPFPTFFITRESFIYRLKYGEMIPDQEWNHKYAKETAAFMKQLTGRASQLIDHIEAFGLSVSKWIIYSDYAFEVHFTNEENAEIAKNLIQNMLIDGHVQARIHRNRSVTNVMFPQTGKGQSLLRLAQTMNLQPEQVLAIGDSLNDLDMLDGHLGFRSGAVGNSAPIVKDVVRTTQGIVAHTRAGWGVAEIIYAYKKMGLL